MNKLNKLKPGKYIADFRYDEGIRIRDDFICPTLNTGLRGGQPNDNSLSSGLYLIEVLKNDESTDKTGD